LNDTESLPQNAAGEFVKSLFDIVKQHEEITNRATEAVDTMRKFLRQHRYLQSALKECPAVAAYLPNWMKQELEREPEKRTRRKPTPKVEKEKIDMSQLVIKATVDKLNL
jgi:hypothetical protein